MRFPRFRLPFGYRGFRLLQGLVLWVGLLVGAGYLASMAWESFGPHKPELSAARKELVDDTLPEVLTDLREVRGAVRRLVVVPFESDSTGYVTDRLRQRIEESGIFELVDRPLDEKLRQKLNLPLESAGGVSRAVGQARGMKAEAVVFGSVAVLESLEGEGHLALEVGMALVEADRVLLKKTYEKTHRSILGLPRSLSETTGRFSGTQRFLGWALLVLLLPMVTINFIRATVRKESNSSNGATLGIYTLVDGVMAYLLLGVSLTLWLPALAFAGLLGAAFAYNVMVMSFALKLEV